MFPANIVFVQPVVPSYRVPFFKRLADHFGTRLAVFASRQDLGVLTQAAAPLHAWERRLGGFSKLPFGLEWQLGAMSIPLARGDILIVSGAPRGLSNMLLMVRAKLMGVKAIWWGHYWSSTSRPWRAAIRMRLMRFADAVIFYTDDEVTEYLATRPADKRIIMALNNGIERGEIGALRSPYVAASRSRDLLFIGRLTKKAELELLLDALAAPRCRGIQLDVIGGGELEISLKQMCVELGIADNVRWHGGEVEERRIAEIANCCKAFVYPGGVGLSLMHGLTYGLPAIVHGNRRLHMPEFSAFRNNENGVIFEHGNVDSLSEVIIKILGDHEGLENMSSNAIKSTEETFNTDDMARRFCRLIDEVFN